MSCVFIHTWIKHVFIHKWIKHVFICFFIDITDHHSSLSLLISHFFSSLAFHLSTLSSIPDCSPSPFLLQKRYQPLQNLEHNTHYVKFIEGEDQGLVLKLEYWVQIYPSGASK
ncbi:uncharacterized protein A4U43_C04F3410 [Asparagus officinalis]|uniref:Uncharacterized protein n=1 Tax=Asparagus officinalis TaxID=4686 RepID=A0A5P1EZR0_ASPOF|nr:uncharacterized protein A4U43_C04F3410 [Asparagus officinalis]